MEEDAFFAPLALPSHCATTTATYLHKQLSYYILLRCRVKLDQRTKEVNLTGKSHYELVPGIVYFYFFYIYVYYVRKLGWKKKEEKNNLKEQEATEEEFL